MKIKKILVIAPHADDEVLGCGGYLLHEQMKGSEICIIYGAVGGKMYGAVGGGKIAADQDFTRRYKEAESLNKALSTKNWFVMHKGLDAYLDTVPDVEIITALDVLIGTIRPDELFVNYSSHHQDHRKMYQCAMASLRLREGYSPSLVALYEYPFIGGNHDVINGGRWYHDITDVIDRKIELFGLYGSQLKNPPSPLNETGIRSLAGMRGIESGCQYAEMFYVQKMMR